MLDPVVNKSAAENKILNPASKRLQRWVGSICPHDGYMTVNEAVVHGI